MAEDGPPASPLDDVSDAPSIASSPLRSSLASEASSPGSSSDTTVGALLAKTVANPTSDLDTQIVVMKAERARLKSEKAKLAKELRNNERKRARLKGKAKALSSQDLLEVLQFRAQDQSKVAVNKKAKTEKAAGK